jgi:putative ABC transport system substrate-binding protein
MKKLICLLSVLACGTLNLADAQQPKKIPQVGFLLYPSRSAAAESLDAFRQGMRELGYVEGQNVVIEYRYAEGKFDRLADFAKELVRLQVDVIVASGGLPVIRSVKDATSTIPIVMTSTADPVASGLAVSLARPGGNVTGPTIGGYQLIGKRLELLKETFPKVSRVAVFLSATSPGISLSLNEFQTSAHALGLQIQSLEVRGGNDFDRVFQAAVQGRANALTVDTNPVFTSNRKQILEFAAKSRWPTIYPWRAYVEDGGLMSYDAKLSDLYRRVATYVSKILKGAKPSELPIEEPTKFELTINLKTAKEIGLIIPQRVLLKADRVIK